MLPAGSILFTSRAPIGYVAIAAQPLCTNQGFKSLVPPTGISSEYLYWYMQYATNMVKTRASGTTFAEISGKAMASVPVVLAPTNEQRRIVAAIEQQFSRLDDGLVSFQRVALKINHLKSAILQMAVTGNLVDQNPSEESGHELVASIQLQQPSRRKRKQRAETLETSMPALPPSWATAPWSVVGESQNGRAFPSADYQTGGTRLLRPGNLHVAGDVEWTSANTRHLPDRYACQHPDYLVGPNEIIMNLTAQSLKDDFLGRVCMTGPLDSPVLLNQRLARLSPVGMNARFVFWVLRAPMFRRFVAQLNTGSLIQHMFTSQLDQFVLPIPPRAEQDRIVSRLEESLSLVNRLEAALRLNQERMPTLRSSILKAAFSGSLVRQDPEDEPATLLLKRIEHEQPIVSRKKARQHPALDAQG